MEEYKENTQEQAKSKLVRLLFDKKNPEMITYLLSSEVDRFANLIILSEQENDLRKTLNIKETNIMEKILKEHLVLRTSIKGNRAEQGVKIITSALEEEKQQGNFFTDKLKSIIGR